MGGVRVEEDIREGIGDMGTTSTCDRDIVNDNASREGKQVISILYGNVRSILNKLLELKALVNDLKPSIILLCETFARSDIGDALLAIEGYECIVRQDGTTTEGGKCRGLLQG